MLSLKAITYNRYLAYIKMCRTHIGWYILKGFCLQVPSRTVPPLSWLWSDQIERDTWAESTAAPITVTAWLVILQAPPLVFLIISPILVKLGTTYIQVNQEEDKRGKRLAEAICAQGIFLWDVKSTHHTYNTADLISMQF